MVMNIKFDETRVVHEYDHLVKVSRSFLNGVYNSYNLRHIEEQRLIIKPILDMVRDEIHTITELINNKEDWDYMTESVECRATLSYLKRLRGCRCYSYYIMNIMPTFSRNLLTYLRDYSQVWRFVDHDYLIPDYIYRTYEQLLDNPYHDLDDFYVNMSLTLAYNMVLDFRFSTYKECFNNDSSCNGVNPLIDWELKIPSSFKD